MSKAAADTRVRRLTNYLLLGALWLVAPAGAALPEPTSEDLSVPALDPGIELHLRHRAPPPQIALAPERVVLLVHGATYPASSAFDTDLPGGSWMAYIAARGYDVYALDVRGYGGSTRPPAMSQPPEANPPVARTAEAVRDISAAVDHILKTRGVSKLMLIGWSWGTTTTATYAAEHPDKVSRLVLFAPVWLGVQAPKFQGAYRTSTYESARAFALAGMPKDRIDDISPKPIFDTWWKATLATDPEGARQSPPVVRAPNGALRDFAELWAAGKPPYDPARIRASTLLIVGEWDMITPPLMAQTLYGRLTQAAERRLVLLSEGTHFLAVEKHRFRLMREVQNFLDES